MSELTFKELGRNGAIAKLYESSGFTPADMPFFSFKGEGFSTLVQKVLLEGIDFSLEYFPLKHLGYKTVVIATGELFAVMSTPKVLSVTLSVSAKIDYPEVSQIWDGVVQAAKEFGYSSVALDIQPSLTGLSIAVSAVGSEGKYDRPKAKSMDLICISNNAGAAFLGSQLMDKCRTLDEKERSKKLDQYRQIVGAYLRPEVSAATLSALKDSGLTPSFGYFCTRGLAATIRTLCADSGLGAKIYADKIPLAGGTVDLATYLNVDPLQAALRGGDDNCILYVIPIEQSELLRHDFQSWDIIGHLARPEVGPVLVSPDSLEHEL